MLKLLKKKNQPLTSKEIAGLIDIGQRSVRRILSNLQKDCLVNLKVRKLTTEEIIKRYGKLTNSPNLKVYLLKKW